MIRQTEPDIEVTVVSVNVGAVYEDVVYNQSVIVKTCDVQWHVFDPDMLAKAEQTNRKCHAHLLALWGRIYRQTEPHKKIVQGDHPDSGL